MQPSTQKPIRNRLFGRDLSVADGIFPKDLEIKLESGSTTYDSGEYWHLFRLADKANNYRRMLPLGWVALIAIEIVGLVVLHIGYIQTMFLAVLGYWSVGLWVKAKAVLALVEPLIIGRKRPASLDE